MKFTAGADQSKGSAPITRRVALGILLAASLPVAFGHAGLLSSEPGIASKVGFADVKNHLTSRRLRDMMGTDEFAYHGYSVLLIDGRWVKATPAFNRSLCDKAGVLPLEFDGVHDSLLHPLDTAGRKHMEYLRDHGSFAEVPVQALLASWKKVYPNMERWGEQDVTGDFEQEAVTELRAGG
jgi:hypothetical protein